MVRAEFWQNGFFAVFYFWAALFSAAIVAGFLFFCGGKCPEKSSRKIPMKMLQILHNKNPDTFLQIGQAKIGFIVAGLDVDQSCGHILQQTLGFRVCCSENSTFDPDKCKDCQYISTSSWQGEICVKFSVFHTVLGVNCTRIFRFGHPNPGNYGTRKISPKFAPDFTTPLAEKNREKCHSALCRVVVLTMRWTIGAL